MKLIDHIGIPAMLEQTAEECSELAQACLKLSRYYRNENQTNRSKNELIANMYEEIADVEICIDEILSKYPRQYVEDWKRVKELAIQKRINQMSEKGK